MPKRTPISATVYVRAAMCDVCQIREANETLIQFSTMDMCYLCDECLQAGKRNWHPMGQKPTARDCSV